MARRTFPAVGGHPPAPEEAVERPARTRARVGSEHRVAGGPRHHELSLREPCGHAPRVLHRRAQVSSSPASSSTGTFGSGAVAGGGAGLATGQRPQSVIRSLSSTVARSKGRKSELGPGGHGQQGIPAAHGGVGGRAASPGEGCLLTGRGRENRAELRMRGGGGFPATVKVRRLRRSSGAGSPSSAARTAPGKAARRAGSKSPAMRIPSRSLRPRDVCRVRPLASTSGPRMRPWRRIRPTSCWKIGHRVVGERRARAPAHRAERAGHGGDGVRIQRVGTSGLHHRVEREALHVGGVAGGVGQGHLGPVRGAEDSDAVDSELAPDGLHVLHRVLGGVEGAPGLEAGGAAPGGILGAQQVGPSSRQRSAPERPVPRWSNTITSRLR